MIFRPGNPFRRIFRNATDWLPLVDTLAMSVPAQPLIAVLSAAGVSRAIVLTIGVPGCGYC
jgi:hypothetical protein